MRFGVALPNEVTGATREDMRGFVERAERHGFDSIWALDRLVYDGYATLSLLAWAAGQTERVRIGTSILLAPLYRPLMLAKELATIDRLTGGRFTLGLGMGQRPEDYQAAGVPMERRDLRMVETVALLRQAWSGQPIDYAGRVFDVHVGPVGPRPAQQPGVPIWLGGSNPKAFKRAARLGDGFLAGGGGPAGAHAAIPVVRQALQERGRDPRAFACSALIYWSLGKDADQGAADVANYQQRYYGRLLIDPKKAAVVGSIREAVQRIHEYDDLDLHTLIFAPVLTDPEQVDRLAEVVQAVGS